VRKALAGTLFVFALVAAGCGGGSSSPNGGANGSGNGEAAKSAQQVLADARKAAESASSVHVSGQVTKRGQKISLDVTSAKGKGTSGSITIKGQKIDLVIVGGNAYMKAGPGFWAQYGGAAGSTIAQLLQGKWLKFPTSDPRFAGFTSILSPKTLFDKLTSSHGTITNRGATTYRGQSVVAIFDSGTAGGTLYVAATGTPFPVAIAGNNGSGPSGSITFDRWGKPVTLTAPSGAIDISQLGG
jgi:LppX_LprAFG lipoprotein